ncbi:MAG: hypothetical protein KTR31_36155 [Myxococcales bacterium]|nr:hypothetical protein [Myxococcales bacterium]
MESLLPDEGAAEAWRGDDRALDAARGLTSRRARIRALALLLPVDPRASTHLGDLLDPEPTPPWELLPLVAHRARETPEVCATWGMAATTVSSRHRGVHLARLWLLLGLPEAARRWAASWRHGTARGEIQRLLHTGVWRERFLADPWCARPWPITDALAEARVRGALRQRDAHLAVDWAAFTIAQLSSPKRQRWRALLAEAWVAVGEPRAAQICARSIRARSHRIRAWMGIARAAHRAADTDLVAHSARQLPTHRRTELFDQLTWDARGLAPRSLAPLLQPQVRDRIDEVVADVGVRDVAARLRSLASHPHALAAVVARVGDLGALWLAAEGSLATRLQVLRTLHGPVERRLAPVEALRAVEAARARAASTSCRSTYDATVAILGRTSRSMVQAAAAALTRAAHPESGVEAYEVEDRLEVLARAGGRAVRVLRHRIDTKPVHDQGLRLPLWLALARVDAAAALALAHRAPEHWVQPQSHAAVLATLEAHGAVSVGTSLAWQQLASALAARHGPHAVMPSLAQLVARHSGPAFPPAELLRLAAREIHHGRAESPHGLLERVTREVDRALGMSPRRLARAMVDRASLRAWVRALRPGRLPPVSDEATRQALRVSLAVGVVEQRLVMRVARRLRVRRAFRALVQGRPLAPVAPLLDGHRLRWLDKRVDLLTYQRFADCVTCCYHTRDEYWYQNNKNHIAAIWADPLSFCLHVEHPSRGARGFVFGSFATLRQGADRRLAVLLNGVYLTRQRRQLRMAVLHALVHRFFAPMGIWAVGVAAQHGGYGPFPSRWGPVQGTVMRHRALAKGGALLSEAYDDLEVPTNRWETAPGHLRWWCADARMYAFREQAGPSPTVR